MTASFVAQFSQEKYFIKSVAWSPDSRFLAYASVYKAAIWGSRHFTWNAHTGQQQVSLPGAPNKLVWSNDGQHLFSLGFHAITLLHARTGAKMRAIDVPLADGFMLNGMAVFSDETRIVVMDFAPLGLELRIGKQKPHIHVLDTASGQILLTYHGHKSEHLHTKSLACLPGSRYIVSSGSVGDGTIQIWDGMTGNTVLTYSGHSPYGSDALAVSPDGKRIASAEGSALHVWDVTTGSTLTIIRTNTKALAWSPDGKYIVTESLATVSIWDAATGQRVGEYTRKKKEYERIEAIAWSPDGKYIALGDSDGFVQVWMIEFDPTKQKQHSIDISSLRDRDRILVCHYCGKNFIFTTGEQELYARSNLKDLLPGRCPDCRAARRNKVPHNKKAEKEQSSAKIEEAERLFLSGHEQAAGSIAGVVLETQLKNLCDMNGVTYPRKPMMQSLVRLLQDAKIITTAEAEDITDLASIRNRCAHESFVPKDEVRFLIERVKDFTHWVNHQQAPPGRW